MLCDCFLCLFCRLALSCGYVTQCSQNSACVHSTVMHQRLVEFASSGLFVVLGFYQCPEAVATLNHSVLSVLCVGGLVLFGVLGG